MTITGGKLRMLGDTRLVWFFAAILLLPTLSWGQATGRCATIEAPAPILLPDGSVHEARSLKLCASQRFTPVTMLHELYVDGRPVGRFQSRIDESEGLSQSSPYVVFGRNLAGQLELVGYAWPEGKTMRTYTMLATKQRFVRRALSIATAPATKNEDVIVLAARLE